LQIAVIRRYNTCRVLFAVDQNQTITYKFVFVRSFALHIWYSDIQLDEIFNFGRNNVRPETSRGGELLLIWYYIVYIVHNVIYTAQTIENAKHGKYEIYLIAILYNIIYTLLFSPVICRTSYHENNNSLWQIKVEYTQTHTQF